MDSRQPRLLFLISLALMGVRAQDPCDDPVPLPQLKEYRYQTLPDKGVRVDLGFSYSYRLEVTWFLRNITRFGDITDYYIPPAGDNRFTLSSAYDGNRGYGTFSLTGRNLWLENIKKEILIRVIAHHPCNVLYLQSRMLTFEWMYQHNYTVPPLTEIPRPKYMITSWQPQNLTFGTGLDSPIEHPELVGVFLYGFTQYAKINFVQGFLPQKPLHRFFKYKRPNVSYNRLWAGNRTDKYIYNNNVTFSPVLDEDNGVYFTTTALNFITTDDYWLSRLKIIALTVIRNYRVPSVWIRIYNKKSSLFDPLPVHSDNFMMVPLPKDTTYGFPHTVRCMVYADTHPEVTVTQYNGSVAPREGGAILAPASIFDSTTFVDKSFALPTNADESVYTCSASFDGGREIHTKKFKILYYDPVRMKYPKRGAYYRLQDVKHKSLYLSCEAVGDPRPNIAWYLDEGTYPEPGEPDRVHPGKKDYIEKNRHHQMNSTRAYSIQHGGQARYGERRSWLTITRWEHFLEANVDQVITCYAYNDYSYASQKIRITVPYIYPK